MKTRSLFRTVHQAYRVAYRINRASRTAEALASGNPRRIGHLYTRRALYKLAARAINRAVR